MGRPNLLDNESSNIAFEKDVLNQLGEDDADDDKTPLKPGDLDEETESEEDDAAEGDDTEDSEGENGEDEEGESEGESDELSVKVRSDKRGNLVDPRTGKIVAPAGAARRFYEDLTNAKKQLSSLHGELTRRENLMSQARDAIITLNAQVEAAKKINDLPKQLGLTAQDQAEFMNLAAQFKDNNKAIDTIRYLLTKAAQRGIDIKSLGAGSNAFDPSVFTNDITQKVESVLKPFQDRRDQDEKQEQARNAVRQEIALFTNSNPDAQQYLPVLGKILENPRFSQMGLNGAWLMLQNYLLRKNMRTQSRKPRGRPPGRSRPGVQTNSGSSIDDSPVSVEQSFRDIVKGVIADYGEPE